MASKPTQVLPLLFDVDPRNPRHTMVPLLTTSLVVIVTSQPTSSAERSCTGYTISGNERCALLSHTYTIYTEHCSSRQQSQHIT